MIARPWLIAALTVAVAAAAGVARTDPAGPPGWRRPHVVDDVDQPTLTAAALERALVPYLDGVRDCYLRNVRAPSATGHLRLDVVIERDGDVTRVAASAPGASAKERVRLEACLRTTTRRWHFPVRRGSTWASIPLYFQRTIAPGAGPRPGCWSPRGCPGREGKEKS